MTEPESFSVPSSDDEGTESSAPETDDLADTQGSPAGHPQAGFTAPVQSGFDVPGYAYPPRSGYGYPPPPGYGYPPPPGHGYVPPPGHGYPPLPPGYGVPPLVARNGTPLAEFWQRFAAYAIDSVIVFAINLIPATISVALLWNRFADAFHRIEYNDQHAVDTGAQIHPFAGMGHLLSLELLVAAILLPFVLVVSYLYMVTLMHSSGQTIGKRIMKIKVVRVLDGGPITVSMARKRWLVAQPASMIAPYFSYADTLWLLWDKPYRQCLHDKCAETVVVKSKP